MSKLARSLLRLAFVLPLFAAAPAQAQTTWGGLEPGPYAVGFRFVYRLDHSRGWKASEDPDGYPRAEERGRPVRVGVWYPAVRSTRAARMLFRDYMPRTAPGAPFAELNAMLERRDAANLRAGLKPEGFAALLKTRAAAVLNAAPRGGAFPLVVYSAGLNNSSEDNVVLCEYLASHGYVVITVPQAGTTSLDVNLKFPSQADLETQILDLQFAVGAARDLPNVARGRLGVVGYSVGGVAALNLVMRNNDVDALVTLDPTFGVAPRVRLATDSPHYHPTKVRVPWLYIYRAEPATSLAVFDALKYSRRYRLEMKGMSHRDFSSFPLLAPPEDATAEARRGYETLCRYVLNFFDAQLKGDARGLEFISRAAPEAVAAFEVREAMRPPPTEEKFLKVLEREGFARAVSLYRERRAKDPGQPLFSEDFLNQLGYRLLYAEKRPTEAVEIFKLNVEAYPASANVYDSLGEAYAVSGDRELAIKFYEKSIELNPGNKGAVEAVRKLRGGQ